MHTVYIGLYVRLRSHSQAVRYIAIRYARTASKYNDIGHKYLILTQHTFKRQRRLYDAQKTQVYVISLESLLNVQHSNGVVVIFHHESIIFLLLARYVPNVANRSIWEQCKKKYILRTDRRPTRGRPPSWKIQMAIISAADHPIYSVFGSRMGFSGSADRMALFPVWPNSISMWEKTMRDE